MQILPPQGGEKEPLQQPEYLSAAPRRHAHIQLARTESLTPKPTTHRGWGTCLPWIHQGLAGLAGPGLVPVQDLGPASVEK